MPRLDMEPEARLDLFTTIEAFLGHVSSLHATLGAVMADVAAIRNTIFDNPAEIAAARRIVDEAMGGYANMVEEFVISEQWKN